jgi:hypothetical protein
MVEKPQRAKLSVHPTNEFLPINLEGSLGQDLLLAVWVDLTVAKHLLKKNEK